MPVKDLANNPEYLAYRFNFNTETVDFLPIKRDDFRRVSILKKENIDPKRWMTSVPLAELAELLSNAEASLQENPPRFIFHTAFCASTFLSRCLDVEGVSVALREPQLLLDAANAKRLQWRSKTTKLDYRDLPKLALSLLLKHAGPGEKLVIKPINSVNNIIPELLQFTGSAKSLMLYTDARQFLLSTLRKGESGKHTTRAMFDLIRCDFQHLANLGLSQVIHMTDLNVILTLWRLQIEQARQALQVFTPGNVMASLYGESLIENPLAALNAANRHLDLGIPDQAIDDIANSDSRFDDAKTAGQKFSVEKRNEFYQELESFYGADLEKGYRWMLKNNPDCSLNPKLPGALDLQG